MDYSICELYGITNEEFRLDLPLATLQSEHRLVTITMLGCVRVWYVLE